MKHVTTKTVLLVVLSSIVLGLASLFIGLSIFRDALLQGSISRACTTTARTATAAAHGADIEGLARDVMSVYENLTPEQRSMTGTEEYRQFFRSLDSVGKTGGAHDILVNLLRNYTIDVTRIYICAFDAERNAAICLVDTDPDNPAYPGEWKPAAGNLIEELASLTDYDWNGGNTPYEFTATESEGKVCLAGYPILNENHEKCAYLLTEHYLNDVFAQTNQYALKIVEVVLVLTLLIAFLVGLRMKKTVADPINAIADTATVYVQDRKNGIDRSDHFSSLNIHTGDELENLTNVMADMEQDLIEHE